MKRERILKEFGRRLRVLPEERNLTQERLGELAVLERTCVAVSSGAKEIRLYLTSRELRAL